MKEHTYIKFYRKTLENQVWREDPTAWRVFEALLCLAGRATGSWSGGRHQLAALCGINPNTLYSALLRLEGQHMVNRLSNTNYTTYFICNWEKYQQPVNNDKAKTSTARQHSNKNNNNTKLSKDTNVSLSNLDKPAYGRSDINGLIAFFEELHGFPPSRGKMNRYALKRLLDQRKLGVPEIERLLKAAKQAQDEDEYAPRVFNFLDLEQKLPNILDYYRKKEQAANTVAVIE